MTKKHGVDIFKVLDQISRKNTSFYDNLSESEQKAIAPLVVMRWLTGTTDARQIYFINELLNPFIFSFYKDKKMLMNLATLCTTGKPQKYYWNKSKSKKTSSTPKTVDVVRQYLRYNTIQALEVLPLLDDEDILFYAEELGKQPDEIKLIKKELKTRSS